MRSDAVHLLLLQWCIDKSFFLPTSGTTSLSLPATLSHPRQASGLGGRSTEGLVQDRTILSSLACSTCEHSLDALQDEWSIDGSGCAPSATQVVNSGDGVEFRGEMIWIHDVYGDLCAGSGA